MRRTVTVPILAIAAVGLILVLMLIWMTSSGASPGAPVEPHGTGLTGPGGLLDRVLPGGAPMFDRAPAPPH